MNKKLLAVAVAGTLIAPLASADVSVSGSIRVGIEGAQSADDTVWEVKDGTSRLRFRASEDLGNGQTAFANYEFRVNAAKGSLVTGNTQRVTEVGIKGGWGSLGMGSQWSNTWSAVGTHIDKTNTYGGHAYQGEYRMNHSVKYTTTMGALGLGLDAQLDPGGDDVDRATVSIKGAMGNVKYGAAWQDRTGGDYTGVGFGAKMGDLTVSGGYEDVDGGNSSSNVNIGRIAGVYLFYGKKDGSDGAFIANYHHSISKSVSTRVEVKAQDDANAGILILRKEF